MDIPEDIRAIADEIAGFAHATVREPIERALMAERERCAKIAESHNWNPLIAAAIRRGDTA